MKLENLDIRLAVANANVSYREIARKLNITDVHISRLMSRPLSQMNRLKILNALGDLEHEARNIEQNGNTGNHKK